MFIGPLLWLNAIALSLHVPGSGFNPRLSCLPPITDRALEKLGVIHQAPLLLHMSFILCPDDTVFKPTKNLPFKLLLEAKYGNLTCLCTAALGEEVAKVLQELQNLIRRILKPSNLLCGHHTSHRKMAGIELGATGLVNMRFTLENCILKAVGKRTRNNNSWPTHCLLLLTAPQTLSSGCSMEWVKGWSSIKTHLRVHLGYTDVLIQP